MNDGGDVCICDLWAEDLGEREYGNRLRNCLAWGLIHHVLEGEGHKAPPPVDK